MARDYDKEYADYGGTEEQKKRRAQRNKVRRAAIRKHGKEALKGKEIHHENAPRTGSLAGSKTRIVSKKTNRSIQPKRT